MMNLVMDPPSGERLLRFVGDRLRFRLRVSDGAVPERATAYLRTTLGRASLVRLEVLGGHGQDQAVDGTAWRNVPMHRTEGGWELTLTVTEAGYSRAKAFVLDEQGFQVWPAGEDVGITVHPSSVRTANTIYCAFTRLFGPTRHLVDSGATGFEARLQKLEKDECAVLPASGKFRDLLRELPHILQTLNCRILHLLPVNPTPTTYARFGRFGSPYAALDLTGIDPALVEFDRRTTGVDQFEELARGVHSLGGRLFLDLVINHTGWGSWLQENRPEWFQREEDGTFRSPGAWGTVWEDLVELEGSHRGLWEYIADAFLTWCRRGVDGFRCDAGYKVPMPVWRYIIARVHKEFPEAVFLLEGLGGGWADTETLLTEGGMQWAYSELFQEFSSLQVAGYLNHAHRQCRRVGVLVHYSETHDNDRLAQRGRTWALLRNRLSALTSVSGAFGFTCGVEWQATEKIRVHGSTGLAWGNENNLVPELGRLNALLSEHPCFFDHAEITRVGPVDVPVIAFRRESAEGSDHVLVLVNTDLELSQSFTLTVEECGLGTGRPNSWTDLLGQPKPTLKSSRTGEVEFQIEPGAVYCLAAATRPSGLAGDDYRLARAQADFLIKALSERFEPEDIGPFAFSTLAGLVDDDAFGVLGAIGYVSPDDLRADVVRAIRRASARRGYPAVVRWAADDQRRVTLVPPAHWVLIEDRNAFRARLSFESLPRVVQVEAIAVRAGHCAFIPPDRGRGDATLVVERYGEGEPPLTGVLRFLAEEPEQPMTVCLEPRTESVLLTNGRGGMARLCVDFGHIQSKYDCLLGANLHASLPVDRHVLAKRVRLWVNAFGFISPLNGDNVVQFNPGPPARWLFRANAGDGRTVDVELVVTMLPGRNAVWLTLEHLATGVLRGATRAKLAAHLNGVRITARVDIEDRNFHEETKRNGGAEHHFQSNVHSLRDESGFRFTPAEDRRLLVFADVGRYHAAPEWCDHIAHPVEATRGQEGSGDAFSPGWFDLPVEPGHPANLVVSAEADEPARGAPGTKALGRISTAQLDRVTAGYLQEQLFRGGLGSDDAFALRLARAAQAFVVRRDDVRTVIAGYPWFLDWGRDTLICARGLITAGWHDEVRELLIAFGRFEDRGTLPNIIHGDSAGNRDTIDAPLWYGLVCEELAAVTGDPGSVYGLQVDTEGRTVEDVLVSIAQHYWNGTPNGIHADPESALIWSPSHFTWMDTNFPAGTPREGYPVEVQALWIRLLRQLERLERQAPIESWSALATRAETVWRQLFWIEDRGYLADVLLASSDVPAPQATPDSALRNNQLFGVSLGLLKGSEAQRCVEAVRRHLLVPGALRSLAPLPVEPPLPIHAADGRLLNRPEEPYCGRYEGDEDTQRKPAYHNGTAWVWTLPNFCEALALAWGRSPTALAAARSYLTSTDRLLAEGCREQLPEILDGDAPHTQRGCDAQAWSATETLRVWMSLQSEVQ
jgi:predicted glycogen debranching enzyme